MSLVGTILLLLVRIFMLMVLARVITETIEAFSKEFRPPRWFVLVVEPLFVMTDPPVKMLRRFIPPLRTGGVSIDMSVIVLMVTLAILQVVVASIFS